jgi:hypothetical protein
MRKEFYCEVEGQTYAAPQYGKEIILKLGTDLDKPDTIAMTKEAMDELGIKEGEKVEIFGAWTQEATATLYQNDDVRIARMDKTTREALPCKIGQGIGVRKKFIL